MTFYYYKLLKFIYKRLMTERKQKTIFRTANTNSNTKKAIDSSQKPTPLKHNKLKQEVIPARNLMSQFQKLKPTPKKPFQHYNISQDKDAQSLINESSELSCDIYIQNKANIDFRQQSLKFQLPKSYIIAMGGLQEAVQQRDNQLNNLSHKFEEQKIKRQLLEQNVKELLAGQKQLEKSKEQLLLQIRFLKQVNLREKQSHQSNEKLRNQFQVELAISKEKLTLQIGQLKRLVDQLQAQKRTAMNSNYQNESHKQKFLEEIQTLKKRQIQNIQKLAQSKTTLNNQIQRLEKELKNQKEIRLQAEKQITILKNQLNLLAERAVVAEKNQLDCLLAQKSYLDAVQSNIKQRVPLIDVPNINKPNQNILKEETKLNPKQQKSIQQQKPHDMPKLSLHKQKATEISIMIRDRSTSRVNNHAQRPEIISQYRQLLRYQKESIALNYQLQLIEKSLAAKSSGEGRSELQRSYQKLKRQAEQKQLQIRQLKIFLNESRK